MAPTRARRTLATVAVAATLGLTGAALLVPSTALAQAGPAGDRIASFKDALTSLVSDGTLTQSQADEVASTLAEKLPPSGPRGHRGGPDGVGHVAQQEVAKALGIPVEELHTQRRAGKTLAQIAAAKGIDRSTLVSDLVTAAKAQLAAAVKADRITQTRADELSADLQARITEQVDQVRPGPGRHHGGRHHAPGPEDGAAPEGHDDQAPVPDASAPEIQPSGS